MSEEKTTLDGPDLAQGVAISTLAEGAMLLGHTQGRPVILVRRDGELFAIGAVCTHYSGPLAEGLLVGDTVRCPWHHACFSLRTGEALRAPALNPVSCWRIEQRDGRAFVREKLKSASPQPAPAASGRPGSVIIVGGGAAGNAAAEMLRREGYAGRLTMLSADASVPYDRPNLSKNYLAGNAPEDWIPLRSRPLEFGGWACERQDHQGSHKRFRLQGIHAPCQQGRTAIRDQERQVRAHRHAQGFGAA